MPKLCRRCGGARWLLRSPHSQTPLQKERVFSDTPFGRRLTLCTDCSTPGASGRRPD